MTKHISGALDLQKVMIVSAAAAFLMVAPQPANAVVDDLYEDWERIAESELATLRGGFFTGSSAFDFAVTYDTSLDGFEFRTALSAAEKVFNVTVGALNGASFVKDAEGLKLVGIPDGSVGEILEIGAGHFEVMIDATKVAELRDGGDTLDLSVILPVPTNLKVDSRGVVLDIGEELKVLSSLSSRGLVNNVANPLPTFVSHATTLDIQVGVNLTQLLTTVPPFLQTISSQANTLFGLGGFRR